MAASNHHEAEVVPSAAAEQWVLLRRDGDAGREQLLEEQNGDTGKNTPNATEGLGSAVDAEKGWLRSAWNDVSIRNALWNDRRRHVLLATVCANTVFHVLAVWQAEYGPLQALFSCLKHFTTATQCAAVFSMATKFLSLTALKPSPPLKKGQWNYKSGDLVLVNAMILLAACFACTYEVRVGIRVLQEARPGENFAWPLQMLADMTRVQVLAGSVVLTNVLVVLMGVDLRETFRAHTNRLREEWKQLVTEHGPNVPYAPADTRNTLLLINDIILVATLGRLVVNLAAFLSSIVNILAIGVRMLKALLGCGSPEARAGI
ncbi:uncharacterized protein LOC142765093 [Rhipicephalus microplus]|uniref:uncharacterized protein LOC142765093 n=1 Tax=Rhipicephalus microplus TaxID=6941 RepID=UPI003F6B7200